MSYIRDHMPPYESVSAVAILSHQSMRRIILLILIRSQTDVRDVAEHILQDDSLKIIISAFAKTLWTWYIWMEISRKITLKKEIDEQWYECGAVCETQFCDETTSREMDPRPLLPIALQWVCHVCAKVNNSMSNSAQHLLDHIDSKRLKNICQFRFCGKSVKDTPSTNAICATKNSNGLSHQWYVWLWRLTIVTVCNF